MSQSGIQGFGQSNSPDSHVIFMGAITQGCLLRPLELALDADSQGTSRGIVPTLRAFLGKVPCITQHLQVDDWVEEQVVEALAVRDQGEASLESLH